MLPLVPDYHIWLTVYDAATFYTHPDYVDRLNGNSKCGLYGQCTTDVGLVELATAPTGVTPATIAPGERM